MADRWVRFYVDYNTILETTQCHLLEKVFWEFAMRSWTKNCSTSIWDDFRKCLKNICINGYSEEHNWTNNGEKWSIIQTVINKTNKWSYSILESKPLWQSRDFQKSRKIKKNCKNVSRSSEKFVSSTMNLEIEISLYKKLLIFTVRLFLTILSNFEYQDWTKC